MKKRILVLPLSALLIVALCLYKLTQSYDRPILRSRVVKRQAPLFELYDAGSPSKRVRLASYLGRHRIIVVFFDGRRGADRDPRILRLARDAERIERAGIVVFAISDALPPENRTALKRAEEKGIEIPFLLLSDPPPTPGAPLAGHRVHRAWGRIDRKSGKPVPGIFLIDRAGRVEWTADGPKPVSPDDPALAQFIR